tara:strand:- start:5263 stop:7059 length:1797 start_codon:yes stop_codon:yes gene_type:complete
MADKLREGYTEFNSGGNGVTSWFGSWFYPIAKNGKFFAKFLSNRVKPEINPNGTTSSEILPPEPHPLAGDAVIRAKPMGVITPHRAAEVVPQTQEEIERKRRYQEYESMDDYPEIGAAFDIYADDSTQTNLDGTHWEIDTDNVLIKDEINALFDDLNLEKFIWDIVRNTVKYGDCFIELVVNTEQIKSGIQKIKILDPNFIYRIENEYGYLTDFLQEIPLQNDWNNFGLQASKMENKVIIPLDKNQIVHFQLFTSDRTYYPYGKSIAAAARAVYRSLKMMEDAMLVYRLTRAPERRIFYVDTGNLPASKAEHYIEQQKNKFKKEKYFDRNTGQINARFNPMAQDEDFFVAVNGKGSGTKIETLAGAENLGEVDDVKYFRDKLLATLKIPKDYIVEKDQSPERKANLSQLDVKFARVVVRIQQCVQVGLESIAKRHLLIKGFPAHSVSKLKIKLPEPSDMAAKRQLDIDEQKARVVGAIKMNGIFPIEYLYRTYYQLTDEEIEEVKSQLEKEMQDPVLGMMSPAGQAQAAAMGGGMGGPPGAGGAPPGEGGGQEPAENAPPTQNETINYDDLKKLMISEGLSDEAIKIITELQIEERIN